MAKERKLKNLKVLDLKNICTNLSLTTTGNKQRKIELVNSCSCFAICCKTLTISGPINLKQKQSYKGSLDDSVRAQYSDVIIYDCYYSILAMYLLQ